MITARPWWWTAGRERERESTFCKHRIRSGMYEQGHTKVNSFWNFASGNSQQHRATSIVTSLHMYNVGHGSYKSSGVELDWVWVFEWDCNSQQSSFWEPVRSLHCPWSRRKQACYAEYDSWCSDPPRQIQPSPAVCVAINPSSSLSISPLTMYS